MNCPDCGKNKVTLNKVTGLDQCPDREGCGYGWFDTGLEIA